MKTKLFVALSACVLAFAACKKDHSADTSGNGTTTDYQPTSKGSTWNYNSTSQGAFTETATGGDTTIGGQTFFAFDNTATGRRYINKNNGIYTSYGFVPQIDSTITLQYLQDKPTGTTWNQTTTYSGVPVTLTYTIGNRDNAKTVNGTTYQNVIQVTYTIAAAVPLAGTVTIATGEGDYAKGVGLIMQLISTNTSVPGIPQVSDTTSLVSATIK